MLPSVRPVRRAVQYTGARASLRQKQDKAVTRTLTMHLSDAQAERLERFARDRNADLEQTGVRLLDEALRMADHPAIEFRDSVVGRQAYLRGSTLAVWEVVMLARERKNDAQVTAAYLGWSVARVEA